MKENFNPTPHPPIMLKEHKMPNLPSFKVKIYSWHAQPVFTLVTVSDIAFMIMVDNYEGAVVVKWLELLGESAESG